MASALAANREGYSKRAVLRSKSAWVPSPVCCLQQDTPRAYVLALLLRGFAISKKICSGTSEDWYTWCLWTVKRQLQRQTVADPGYVLHSAVTSGLIFARYTRVDPPHGRVCQRAAKGDRACTQPEAPLVPASIIR